MHFKDQLVWGSFCSMNSKGNFDIFDSFQYILAFRGPILINLVTKIKIFWCSNRSWKSFLTIPPSKIRETGWKKLDFIAILAISVEKLGHFWSENRLEIYEQINLLQELIGGAISMSKSRFDRTSKISGNDETVIFGNFSHFGPNLGHLPFRNRQNPWDKLLPKS